MSLFVSLPLSLHFPLESLSSPASLGLSLPLSLSVPWSLPLSFSHSIFPSLSPFVSLSHMSLTILFCLSLSLSLSFCLSPSLTLSLSLTILFCLSPSLHLVLSLSPSPPQLHKQADMQEEKNRIERVLGAISAPDLIQKVLSFALSVRTNVACLGFVFWVTEELKWFIFSP